MTTTITRIEDTSAFSQQLNNEVVAAVLPEGHGLGTLCDVNSKLSTITGGADIISVLVEERNGTALITGVRKKVAGSMFGETHFTIMYNDKTPILQIEDDRYNGVMRVRALMGNEMTNTATLKSIMAFAEANDFTPAFEGFAPFPVQVKFHEGNDIEVLKELQEETENEMEQVIEHYIRLTDYDFGKWFSHLPRTDRRVGIVFPNGMFMRRVGDCVDMFFALKDKKGNTLYFSTDRCLGDLRVYRIVKYIKPLNA